MTDKQKAEAIMKKYNQSYGDLNKKETRKEFMTVLQYVANESNRKQRELTRLDK